jgi:hypothetical protein
MASAHQQLLGLGGLLNVEGIDIEKLEEEVCGRYKPDKKDTTNRDKLYKQLLDDQNDFKRRFGVEYTDDELKSVVAETIIEPDDSISSVGIRNDRLSDIFGSTKEEESEAGGSASGDDETSSVASSSIASSIASSASSKPRRSKRHSSSSSRRHRREEYEIKIDSRHGDDSQVDDVIDRMFDRDIQQFEYNRDHKIQRVETLMMELKASGMNVKLGFEAHKLNNTQLDELYKRLSMIRAGKRNKTIVRNGLVHAGTILETVFNGETEYFGKYKIDFAGASNTIKTKLDHVEFETAEVASDIFGGSSLSPWIILGLEVLLPVCMLPIKNSQEKRTRQEREADRKVANMIHEIKANSN